MSHDTHFLERLERLSLPQVEVALALYRDPALVAHLLAHAQLPDAVERVAISLGDRERGPFLIVARDGAFVTCLGEGMKAKGQYVVDREELATVATRFDHWRARWGEAVSGQVGPRHLRALVGRLFEANADLTREEFAAVAAWQPMLRGTFFRLLVETGEDVSASRPSLMKLVGLRLRPDDERRLHIWWKNVWTMGHLHVLTMIDPGDELATVSRETRANLARHCTLCGVQTLTLRAMWGLARSAAHFTEDYLSAYRSAPAFAFVLDAMLALVAIASAHPERAERIRRVLSDTDALSPSLAPSAREGVVYLQRALRMVFDEPDECVRRHRELGAETLASMPDNVARNYPDKGACFREPSRLPDDIQLIGTLWKPGDYRREGHRLDHVVTLVPWIVRLEAEQLYPPAWFCEPMIEPWKPEHALRLLRQDLDAFAAPRPVRVQPTPRRNDPCTCGSGKKWKRCCGA